MDLLQLVILGLIQGITEFLPISSSAHLIMLPKVMGWQDQGLVNDVAAHVGSLTAVIIYFKKEIRRILVPWITTSPGNSDKNDRQLLMFIVLASLPIMIIGYLFYDFISMHFRNPVIIALASILFGLILWWSDRVGKQLRDINQLGMKDAVLVGMSQVLALIPGTSRSGITMTAGLLLGLDRETAARFSFLLAIPAILMAGGYEAWRYIILGNNTDWPAFFTVAIVAGVSAWLAIHYFLKFLQKTGMLPYVIYRVGLGIVLLIMFVE